MTAESDEWVPPKTSEEEAVEKARKTIIVESRRWLEELSGQPFAHPSDFRGSLRNGIILCEVLNKLKPGCVKRINRRSTPIAGLDNLSVFLTTLQKDFGLSKSHLFDVTDLEDISEKYSGHALTVEDEARALKVTVTLYWLAQQLATAVLAPSVPLSAPSVRPVDPSLFSAGNVIHRRQSSVFSDNESLASSGYVTSGAPVRHSAGFDSVCGTSLDSLDDSCSRPNSSASAAASAPTSGPPPRFHKPDASDLARAAERQMEVARMNRNLAASTVTKTDDDEWRSSLSSWRERRRQQTQGAYGSVPSVEEEEEEIAVEAPKPFRQIVEDNARRKRNFKLLYPLEDEESGGTAASSDARATGPERSLPLSTSLPDRAPWAAAEAEEPVVPRSAAGVQSARSVRSVTSSDRLSAHSNVTSSDRLSSHSNVTPSDRLSTHSNGAPPRSASPASSSSSSEPAIPAGRQRTATMRLARRPREQRFGLQLEAKKGTVLVQKVTRGSTSDVNDVRSGDVIVTIDGQPASSVAEAHRLLEGSAAVQLCVRRSATEEDELEEFSEEDEPVEMRSNVRSFPAYRRSAPAPSTTSDEVEDETPSLPSRHRTPSSGPKSAGSASSLPQDVQDGALLNGRLAGAAVSEPQLCESAKGVRQRISNIEQRNSFFGVQADLEEKKYRELDAASQRSRDSSSERLTALPWQRKCEFRPIKPRLTANQLQLQQQQQQKEQEEERKQRAEREREERAREEEERKKRREEERKRMREEEEQKRLAEEGKRMKEEEERRRVIEEGKRRREEEERRRQREEEERRREEEERRRRDDEERKRQKEEERRRREEEERIWQKEMEERRRLREEEERRKRREEEETRRKKGEEERRLQREEEEERRRREEEIRRKKKEEEEEERRWQREEEERLRREEEERIRRKKDEEERLWQREEEGRRKREEEMRRKKEEERRWQREEEERMRREEEEERWQREERRRQEEEERRWQKENAERRGEEKRTKPAPPRTLPKPQKKFGDPDRGVGEAEALQLLAGIAEMRTDMAKFREQQASNEAEIESVLSSSRSGGSGSPQQRLSREMTANEGPAPAAGDQGDMVAPPVSVRKQVQQLELLAQVRQSEQPRISQHTTSVSSTFSSIDPDTRGSGSRHTSVSPTKSRSGENFNKSDEWLDRSRGSDRLSSSPPKQQKQHVPLRTNRTTLSEVKSRHSPRAAKDHRNAGDYEPPPRPKSFTSERQMLGGTEQCAVRATSENHLMASSLPKDSCLPSYQQYQQQQHHLHQRHRVEEPPSNFHQVPYQNKPAYQPQNQPLAPYENQNHNSGYQPAHIQHHSLQHSPKHTFAQYSHPEPAANVMTTSMYDFNRPPGHLVTTAADDSVLTTTSRSQMALTQQPRVGSSVPMARIPNSHSVDSGLVHHARIQSTTQGVTNPVYATHAHEPKRAHGNNKPEPPIVQNHQANQQNQPNQRQWLVEDALRRQKAEREGFRQLGPREPQVAHQMAPQMAHQVAPQMAHQVAPQMAHQVAHQMAPQMAHQVAPQMAHQVAPQMAHQVAPQMSHQIVPPMGHHHHQAPPRLPSPGSEPPPALPPRIRSSAEAALRQRTRPVLNSRAPCCACNQPLGTGDLMTIESLQLSFHLACFRCVACNTRLGNGRQDADVRVRGNRLYCFNCSAMEEGTVGPGGSLGRRRGGRY